MRPKNIVEYILQNTDLNQTQIGERLEPNRSRYNKAIKNVKYQETPIRQAVISKWKLTGKIPEDRIDELLKIAGIYWNIKSSDEKYILKDHENHIHHIEGDISDSTDEIRDVNWHMLVKSEENQNNWYDIFSQELPNSIEKWKDSDGNHSDVKFLSSVRAAMLQIHDAGIPITPSPLEYDSVVKADVSFQEFIIDYRSQIDILQSWTRDKFPAGSLRDDLYLAIPRIALAQCGDNPYLDTLEMDKWKEFASFAHSTVRYVENTIKDYEHLLAFEIDPSEDIHGYFDILKVLPDRGIFNIITGERIDLPSLNKDKTDFDQYLSYSERKLLEKLQKQEESINDLNMKIDFLIKSLDKKTLIAASRE